MDMNLHDEELQNKIVSGLGDDSREGMAYKRVFDTLAQEPDFHLPINFAEKVLKQIEVKEEKSTAREMYWLVGGICVLSIAGIIGAIMSNFKPSFGAFRFWASYPGLLVFGIFCVLLVQWLDRKLVRPRPSL
jgi:hypothetical protein